MLRLFSVIVAASAALSGVAEGTPISHDSRQTVYGWQVSLVSAAGITLQSALLMRTHSFFSGPGVSNYYLSVGHDETVSGHLLDCGTTSTAFNGVVFAKCTVDGVTPTVTQKDST